MSENVEQTLNELTGNLTGLTKLVATKVLNSGFTEQVKKVLDNSSVENASNALKKLIETAVQKVANGIRLKVAMILTVIVGIFAVFAIIAMLAAGGNIIIPIVVFAVIIAIIWFVTGTISKLIARRISGIIFNAIEGKISQFQKR
jgi:Flp pilus assembly protein TadB